MKNQFSLPPCLSSLYDYLSPQAVVCDTDEDGHAGVRLAFGQLAENRFYLFNGEAALAFALAVEDLALEAANGFLLAGLRDFSDPNAYRERYAQLGSTIDRVEIIGTGNLPARLRRVKLIKDPHHACNEYRLTAYQGRDYQVLFAARQLNHAPELEEKQFFGFYTLEPRLITRLGKEFVALASGKGSGLREFARQAAIDQAAKQLERQFARQKQSLHAAMRRLQLDAEHYGAGSFADNLEKGLSELYQWKTRMPEILARAEGR